MHRPLRIVVADDEPDMRDYFCKILPRLGHAVVATAATGLELVNHCRALHPDLVITDIKMPDMDGIEAAEAICKERPIPIILISAYYYPQRVENAETNYFISYLVKPIRQADLELVLAMALRHGEQGNTSSKGVTDRQ